MKRFVRCGIWITILGGIISLNTAHAMTYMKQCSAIPDPLYAGEDANGCGTNMAVVFADSEMFSGSFLSSPYIQITLTGNDVSAYSIFITAFDSTGPAPIDDGTPITAQELANIEFPCGAHASPDEVYTSFCTGIYPNAVATTSFIIPQANYSQYFPASSGCSISTECSVEIGIIGLSPSDAAANYFTGFTLTRVSSSAPEPASFGMLSVGGLVFGLLRARRRRVSQL